MSKYETAEYLVNLHTLMQAQEATGVAKSNRLLEEYKRTWDAFKEEIEEDETRNSKQPSGGAKAGASLSRR